MSETELKIKSETATLEEVQNQEDSNYVPLLDGWNPFKQFTNLEELENRFFRGRVFEIKKIKIENKNHFRISFLIMSELKLLNQEIQEVKPFFRVINFTAPEGTILTKNEFLNIEFRNKQSVPKLDDLCWSISNSEKVIEHFDVINKQTQEVKNDIRKLFSYEIKDLKNENNFFVKEIKVNLSNDLNTGEFINDYNFKTFLNLIFLYNHQIDFMNLSEYNFRFLVNEKLSKVKHENKDLRLIFRLIKQLGIFLPQHYVWDFFDSETQKIFLEKLSEPEENGDLSELSKNQKHFYIKNRKFIFYNGWNGMLVPKFQTLCSSSVWNDKSKPFIDGKSLNTVFYLNNYLFDHLNQKEQDFFNILKEHGDYHLLNTYYDFLTLEGFDNFQEIIENPLNLYKKYNYSFFTGQLFGFFFKFKELKEILEKFFTEIKIIGDYDSLFFNQEENKITIKKTDTLIKNYQLFFLYDILTKKYKEKFYIPYFELSKEIKEILNSNSNTTKKLFSEKFLNSTSLKESQKIFFKNFNDSKNIQIWKELTNFNTWFRGKSLNYVLFKEEQKKLELHWEEQVKRNIKETLENILILLVFFQNYFLEDIDLSTQKDIVEIITNKSFANEWEESVNDKERNFKLLIPQNNFDFIKNLFYKTKKLFKIEINDFDKENSLPNPFVSNDFLDQNLNNVSIVKLIKSETILNKLIKNFSPLFEPLGKVNIFSKEQFNKVKSQFNLFSIKKIVQIIIEDNSLKIKENYKFFADNFPMKERKYNEKYNNDKAELWNQRIIEEPWKNYQIGLNIFKLLEQDLAQSLARIAYLNENENFQNIRRSLEEESELILDGLDEIQQFAVKNAINSTLHIINGEAGTGKSTVIQSLYENLTQKENGGKKMKVLILTPTNKTKNNLIKTINKKTNGQFSKDLRSQQKLFTLIKERKKTKERSPKYLELTGQINDLQKYFVVNQIKTIHSFLGFDYESGAFLSKGDDFEKYDVIILDEFGMNSYDQMILLFKKYITLLEETEINWDPKNINYEKLKFLNKRFILLGDHNQLAAINAGDILFDINSLEITQKFITTLQKNYRTQEESKNIILMAKMLLDPQIKTGTLEKFIQENNGQGGINFIDFAHEPLDGQKYKNHHKIKYLPSDWKQDYIFSPMGLMEEKLKTILIPLMKKGEFLDETIVISNWSNFDYHPFDSKTLNYLIQKIYFDFKGKTRENNEMLKLKQVWVPDNYFGEKQKTSKVLYYGFFKGDKISFVNNLKIILNKKTIEKNINKTEFWDLYEDELLNEKCRQIIEDKPLEDLDQKDINFLTYELTFQKIGENFIKSDSVIVKKIEFFDPSEEEFRKNKKLIMNNNFYYPKEIHLESDNGLVYVLDPTSFDLEKEDYIGFYHHIKENFDLGYAATVHKFQGSEAQNVILVSSDNTTFDIRNGNYNNGSVIGLQKQEHELRFRDSRFNYTAITRPRKNFYYILQPAETLMYTQEEIHMGNYLNERNRKYDLKFEGKMNPQRYFYDIKEKKENKFLGFSPIEEFYNFKEQLRVYFKNIEKQKNTIFLNSVNDWVTILKTLREWKNKTDLESFHPENNEKIDLENQEKPEENINTETNENNFENEN